MFNARAKTDPKFRVLAEEANSMAVKKAAPKKGAMPVPKKAAKGMPAKAPRSGGGSGTRGGGVERSGSGGY
jgi:hypothetical protein